MVALTDAIRAGVDSLPFRLLLNLFFVLLVVRGVYARRYHRDYAFTYLLLNVVTFFLSFVLSHVRVDIGFAMGLFAVFGILRYRTESVEVRDLTYLFVVIGLAVLNAQVSPGVSLTELLLADVAIVTLVAVLEATPFSRRQETRRVVYDRLDLLRPERSGELLADLRLRTQLPIERCEIGDVDLFRDTAVLLVSYARAHAGGTSHTGRGPAA